MRKVLLTLRHSHTARENNYHTSPNESSPCWWNTFTVVVTFSLSGACALFLPNITTEHSLTFPMHSFLHDAPSLSQEANEPANASWEEWGWGVAVVVGQSTFSGRVSGAANRFFSHIYFHFDVCGLLSHCCCLAFLKLHFIIPHAHKKRFISSGPFP